MNQYKKLSYSPTEKDYETVLRLYFLRNTATKVSLIILVIAFLVVLYLVISKGTPPTPIEVLWLLLPAFLIFFTFFIQPRRVAKQAALKEELMTEATWELNNEGILISSSYGSTFMGWSSLDRLLVTKDHLLVLSKGKKNAFRFVPRRIFSSPDEEAAYIELVNRHIGN